MAKFRFSKVTHNHIIYKMLTFRYRLYPSKTQKALLWKHANLCNKLYNYFLDQRIKVYSETKKSITRFAQQKEIVELKKSWLGLKDIHSQVLQGVTKRLDITYKSFFKRGFGFARFRSCKKFFGICYPQSGYSVENGIFKTKAYGKIKFKEHRKMLGEIKQVQVTTDGKSWFLCVTTDANNNIRGKSEISIDLGTKNIVTDATGKLIIPNSTHSQYFDKRISLLKSRQSRTKRGSRKHKRFAKVVKRLYGVKSRKTCDFLHKVSKDLSRYDTVVCEDLAVKNMTESVISGLNRNTRNASLGRFVGYLSYKVPRLIKVNPAFTSQVCNNCGAIHKMDLSQRVMSCSCGNTKDRDINAARNIHCLGRAFLSSYTRDKSVESKDFLFDVIKHFPFQEAPAFMQG